jgi:hypothetical protein
MLPPNKRKIPHQFRGGTIRELADMYSNPLAYGRETVSNAIDQSRHPEAAGKRIHVKFYLHKLSRKITIVDDLTGIKDMKEFISIGTEYATRDSGKIVGDQISSYENIHPEIIGQKHFGKLSCLFASETGNVEFYSNNGENGHYLHADYEGWEQFDYELPFKTIDTAEALEHIGLKVVIQDAKPDCLKIKSLESALSRWFGLLLRRKKIVIEIIDVDNSNKVVQVKAPDDLDTHGERTDNSLEMSRGGNIRVNLVETDAPSLTPNIDFYQKEIYVCSIKLPYLTKGYVIYNGLELVPNRENFKDSPEFSTKLGEYLAAHFKIEYVPEQPKLERNELKQIHEILSEVLTTISKIHANLLPDMIGDSSNSGVPGKAADREHSDELIRWDNVQYSKVGNRNGSDIYPRGPSKKIKKKSRRRRIKAKTGKSENEGIQDGGQYSVEVKEVPEEEEEEEKLIQPHFEIIDAHREGKPTVFFEKPQDEPLTLVINSFRPASSVARIAKGKYRRDILADKIIRAAYRFTYKGNDLNEFENMVEETWNAMYKS